LETAYSNPGVRWDIVVVVDGKWKRQAKTRRNRKKREE
jgi:hypothetical protein